LLNPQSKISELSFSGSANLLVATRDSYNGLMEVGIREAKNNLSKLIELALAGEEIFLSNRGERVLQLVPTPRKATANRGRGEWKDKIKLYAGWDSAEADREIENTFEVLHEDVRQ
jgi:prevent-host-death family protein